MAEGNLSACLPTIFREEGGLSLDRSDAGNWTGGKVGVGELRGTNFGIAASSHPTLDIRSLTKDDAAAIYNREYWSPAGCAALPAGLDLTHFDATVNSGRGHSAKWLAEAQQSAGTDVAGSIHAYAACRVLSMHGFGGWVRYGKAWAARVARVEAASLKMALGSAAPAVIAKAADKAGTRTFQAGAAAGGGALATVASVAEAVHAHPVAGGLAALASVAWTIFSGFFASASAQRAAVLRAAS